MDKDSHEIQPSAHVFLFSCGYKSLGKDKVMKNFSHADPSKHKEKALLLEEEKERTLLETRENAFRWLWIGFWGKWIFTTILGVFFLLALTPCIKLLSTSDKSLWTLISMQALISILVFFLALCIFLYLLQSMRAGLLWPLYVLGMYEVLLIFILGTETMGYAPNPHQGLDVLETLTSYSCSLIPQLNILFRFSMAMIMGFLCLGAYACFTLYKNPIKPSSPQNL
jgi:hypothetical protein